MFGNLGMGELMIILVIVLVLFGAKRIPEISGSLGKGIAEFKKNMNDVESTVTSAIATPPRQAPPSVERARDYAADDAARPEPKRLL